MIILFIYYKRQTEPLFEIECWKAVTDRLLLTSATKILAKLNSLFFGVNPDLVQDQH